MATPSLPASEPLDSSRPRRVRRRRLTNHGSLLSNGEPMIWLTGGALAIALLMIATLLVGIVANALPAFWPSPLLEIKTVEGRILMGEPTRTETYVPEAAVIDALPAAARDNARRELAKQKGQSRRILYRTGNFELTGEHFNWVSDFQTAEISRPEWGVVLERLESGRFYGIPVRFLVDGKEVAHTPESVWEHFEQQHAAARQRAVRRLKLEQDDIGQVSARQEDARLALSEALLDHRPDSPQVRAAQQAYQEARDWATHEFARIRREIDSLSAEDKKYQLVMKTWLWTDHKSSEVEHNVQVSDIVRAYPANRLALMDKLGIYASRWWEFVSANPRQANSAGGVFPAIWGTVVMTLIMSILVVPFGVLAALYLREYAKGGWIVSFVRIAINNLAGVPSIVFGVFGLGFFCYIIGGYVDGGPQKLDVSVWPLPKWFALLGLLAALATGGFLLGIYNLSSRKGEVTRRAKLLGRISVALWVLSSVLFVMLLVKMPEMNTAHHWRPFFHGLYRAKLPEPTFCKGGLLWSSLTLALLTLPVVIVATEEALAAVPNSMREGSYGCGASKWQTIRRIVLPRAMPGIMTGMILAMARGAGEVAPLMLVGAVKIAARLPVDLTFPFIHLDRSFMHLGFHIYDLGFQSQNSEAAVPMIYATTLLLLLIIAALNLAAIWLRGRLQRKFVGGHF